MGSAALAAAVPYPGKASRISRKEHSTIKHNKKKKKKKEEERDSNSKTLFYKDCSLGSVKNLAASPC